MVENIFWMCRALSARAWLGETDLGKDVISLKLSLSASNNAWFFFMNYDNTRLANKVLTCSTFSA